MPPKRASDDERGYFHRVAEGSGAREDDAPPRSLSEMFRRLDSIRRSAGSLARAGVPGEDESELRSHMPVYERWKEIRARGAERR